VQSRRWGHLDRSSDQDESGWHRPRPHRGRPLRQCVHRVRSIPPDRPSAPAGRYPPDRPSGREGRSGPAGRRPRCSRITFDPGWPLSSTLTMEVAHRRRRDVTKLDRAVSAILAAVGRSARDTFGSIGSPGGVSPRRRGDPTLLSKASRRPRTFRFGGRIRRLVADAGKNGRLERDSARLLVAVTVASAPGGDAPI